MSTIDEAIVGLGAGADEVLDALRKILVVLKLAAYAADAMRVFALLQQEADRCPGFDQAIKSACVDWRNPGSLDDPADLITEALVQVSSAMTQILTRQPVRQSGIT